MTQALNSQEDLFRFSMLLLIDYLGYRGDTDATLQDVPWAVVSLLKPFHDTMSKQVKSVEHFMLCVSLGDPGQAFF